MKKITFKIDMKDLILKREGKAHGPEIARGTGVHVPKKFKEKHKNKWKQETKKYLD